MAPLRHFVSIFLHGLALSVIYSQVSATRTIELNSDHRMPVIGLGTAQIEPKDIEVAVTSALENSYRHIDTAFIYDNEESIGKALKKWFDKGNKREDLFVTTKLPQFGNRYADVETYLNASLKNFGLDYIDMYLVHMPTSVYKDNSSLAAQFNLDGSYKFDYHTDHVAIWKAMEAQVKAGRAKSIGLSNFNETQIRNIVKNVEIKPSNLQLQIYNQQSQLRYFCRTNNIAVTAYSSLGSPGTNPDYQTESFNLLQKPINNTIVTRIAKSHGKTPAQVLLRHQSQEGVIVIPKSTNPKRIRENMDIFDFELSTDELEELDALDIGEKGRIYDLFVYKGIEKHPYYPWSAQISKAWLHPSTSCKMIASECKNYVRL